MDRGVKRGIAALGGGVLMSMIALPFLVVLLLSGNGLCGAAGGAPPPGPAAANGIPSTYLALYEQAAQDYGLDWSILAAIGFVETGHGSNTNTSYAGARGPMQFMPGTWTSYGVDGNRDGVKDILDPRDAIPGAANYLRASGAPGDYHRAIYAYNHAEWYVQKVLAKAREYAGAGRGSREPAGGARTLRSARASAAMPTSAPALGPAHSSGVLNLGDSLAVGSGGPLAGLLSEQKMTSLAAQDRTSSQGLAVLRGVADVPAAIVVQLGTNDADVARFRRNVRGVLAIARRHSAKVVWVNIARPVLAGTSDRQLNAVLASAQATHENVTIVDWHGAVASGRVRLPDGVHPGPEGYAVRAQLIATALGIATPGAPVDSVGPVGICADAGGLIGTGNGSWTLAPNANREGVGLTPRFAAFIDRMATFYTGRLVVTTGTQHNQFVAGTTRESDHWQGNGADFGMVLNHGTNDGPVGDAIAAAAFMAAGVPHDEAIARGRAGGGITIVVDGVRIQIIWKVGGSFGNHHDHVHVGMGAEAPSRPAFRAERRGPVRSQLRRRSARNVHQRPLNHAEGGTRWMTTRR